MRKKWSASKQKPKKDLVFLCHAADGKSREERLKEAGLFYLEKDQGKKRNRKQKEDELWQVGRGEFGKPFFTVQPRLFFSISHSGELWACVMSDAPIGLDIQIHTRMRGETKAEAEARYGRMAARFFSPEETDYVRQSPEPNFFRLWTAHESYVKYTGRGIDKEFGKKSLLPRGENRENGRDKCCQEEREECRENYQEGYPEKVRSWQVEDALYFHQTDWPEGTSLCLCSGRDRDFEIFDFRSGRQTL